MATRLSNAARSAAADAVTALVNAGAGAGILRIYTGSQPAGPDTAASGTLLASFTLNEPAYAAAVNGVADLDVTPALSTTGAAAGTAGWFRIVDGSGGSVGVIDGDVGTSGADLNLNTTTISVGLSLSISSGTYTQPASE